MILLPNDRDVGWVGDHVLDLRPTRPPDHRTRVITGSLGTYTTAYGGFNSANQPGWMEYPDGEVVTFDYNPNGVFEGLEGNSVYAEDMLYDEAGRLTQIVRGNDVLNYTQLHLLRLGRDFRWRGSGGQAGNHDHGDVYGHPAGPGLCL